MISEEQKSKRVLFHQLPNGKEPFVDWLNAMKDAKSRRRVLQRLSRLESGNFGDCKPLKDGICELRLHFGSGYRVYYAEQGDTVVILLCGGDKSTQSKDIAKAKEYWKSYETE